MEKFCLPGIVSHDTWDSKEAYPLAPIHSLSNSNLIVPDLGAVSEFCPTPAMWAVTFARQH